MSSKVLVLGANGFIGKNLIKQLLRDGYFIRAFDNAFVDSEYAGVDNIETIQGDFLNKSDLDSVLSNIDYVYHLVSTTTPISAENDPIVDIETNITGSVQLFQECIRNGVKKIIFPSSGGTVYGENKDISVYKETDLTNPLSPYGIGKVTIENYLRYFYRKFGLDYTVFRIANPYGSGQSLHKKQGVIPIFMNKILDGEKVGVLGDGSMVRDYIFIDDVTSILSRSIDRSLKYHIYNLGSGNGSSVIDILKAIEKATGKTARVEYQPQPKTFVQKNILDTTRLMREFPDFKPIDLTNGIQRFYDSIQ